MHFFENNTLKRIVSVVLVAVILLCFAGCTEENNERPRYSDEWTMEISVYGDAETVKPISDEDNKELLKFFNSIKWDKAAYKFVHDYNINILPNNIKIGFYVEKRLLQDMAFNTHYYCSEEETEMLMSIFEKYFIVEHPIPAS